jgi:N-acetylglucosamine kinase
VSTERYVVGVDGGASKTIALVGTEDGRILGRGETGSSNHHNVGAVAASKAIKDAIIEAKRRSGLRDVKLEIAVVALAAIDSSRDSRVATRFVRQVGLAKRSYAIHDSVAALYAATRGKPGIIVNSGTGCFAAGTSSTRRYVRVGGWGNLIDDRGSAFDIGMRAITMGFRMMDGRTPRTHLISVLKRGLRVKKFDEILDLVYVKRIGVDEIARLAPLVSKAATSDGVCREILKKAGLSLAELVCTAARELQLTGKRFSIYTTGGGFRAGPPLLGPFTSEVKKRCPKAQITRLEIEPVKGSFWLAGALSSGGQRGESLGWVTLSAELR